MRIDLKRVSVRDIVNSYRNDAATGRVSGYGGLLDIRPPFQREYVYKDKDRDDVIRSIRSGLPLNVMYWNNKENGEYEVMDGQQRTISFCDFVNGGFSVDFQYFHNLTPDEQKAFLDYECMIYFCDGTQREKLEWFRIINKMGVPLTEQELLNAVHTGPWLADAKKYFSKPGGPCSQVAEKYLSGSAIRQNYLETALTWVCDRDGVEIAEYMAQHQHDATALELWSYFRSVIDWVDRSGPGFQLGEA